MLYADSPKEWVFNRLIVYFCVLAVFPVVLSRELCINDTRFSLLLLYTFYHESWQVNELRVIATKLRKFLLPVTYPPKETGRDLLPARPPAFLHLLVTHTRRRLPYRSRPGPVRVICIPLADCTFARVPETRVKPRLPFARTSPTIAKSAYCLRTLIHPLKHLIFPSAILAIMLPYPRLHSSRDTQLHFICLNSTSIYRPYLSLHFLRIPELKRIQREKSSCHWVALHPPGGASSLSKRITRQSRPGETAI